MGDLVREMDARSRTTYYEHDGLSRQKVILYEDGTRHEYDYDEVGNLLRAVAPHGTSYFAYDKVNRQTRDQEPFVGTSYFEYDAVGNRTKLGYPGGGEAEHTFDAANRMANLVSPEGNATYYSYDLTGLMTRKLLGNASAAYFAYDTAGRLSSLKNAKSDGTPLSYFEYGRLAGGNIEKILREDDTTVYYTYDLADRLVDEDWRASDHSQLYAFSYDYDAAGNRTTEDKDGTSVYYYYDAANELTEKQQGGDWTYFAYDENGSQIRELSQATGKTTYYEYADNGLVSKVAPACDSPSEFRYDARMQRFAINFAGTYAYFAWDGMNQLVEKDISGTRVARHTHGATPIEGIGSIVESNRYQSCNLQYPHYDHRGSLFNLEDSAAQDLEIEYAAFGEEISRTGAAATRFGYQGTAWMRFNSGLYVSPTRLYIPAAGRFGQVDPAPTAIRRQSATEGVALGAWDASTARALFLALSQPAADVVPAATPQLAGDSRPAMQIRRGLEDLVDNTGTVPPWSSMPLLHDKWLVETPYAYVAARPSLAVDPLGLLTWCWYDCNCPLAGGTISRVAALPTAAGVVTPTAANLNQKFDWTVLSMCTSTSLKHGPICVTCCGCDVQHFFIVVRTQGATFPNPPNKWAYVFHVRKLPILHDTCYEFYGPAGPVGKWV